MLSREQKIEKVLELWDKKYTSTEISIEIGITRNAVMGIIHRHGKRKTALKKVSLKGIVRKKPKAPRQKVEQPKTKLTIPQKYVPISEPFPEKTFVKTKGKKLLDLGPFDCRWVWDDGSFCAKPTMMCSYCTEHKAIVYVPIKKRGE